MVLSFCLVRAFAEDSRMSTNMLRSHHVPSSLGAYSPSMDSLMARKGESRI